MGPASLWVACGGVALPFVFGWIVGGWLGFNSTAAIFLGATLTATSVGITARVFYDLGYLETKEAKIVLGAAVADDVIGLVILAIVSGLGGEGKVSSEGIVRVALIAVVFLVGAIVVGTLAARRLTQVVQGLRTRGAATVSGAAFCLVLAALAGKAGLAPIVGAFAAGLVLAGTEMQTRIAEKVEAIADIFVPVFFVMVGAQMDWGTLNPATLAGRETLVLSGLILLVAILGKVLGCATAPWKMDRWVVSVGMIPRGEVGLIFATIGLRRELVNAAEYAAILNMVVLTTVLTPILLAPLVKRTKRDWAAAPHWAEDLGAPPDDSEAADR